MDLSLERRAKPSVEIKALKRSRKRRNDARGPVFRIMRHDARGLGAGIVPFLPPAPGPVGATRIDGTGALPDRKEAPSLFGKRGDRSRRAASVSLREQPSSDGLERKKKNQPRCLLALSQRSTRLRGPIRLIQYTHRSTRVYSR